MKLKDYTELRELAPGASKGKDKDGNLVLIKSFAFNSGSDWNGFRQIERELEILKQLNHPQIPKVIEFWQDDSQLYLVREYVEGKPLVTSKHRTETEIRTIAIELLEILQYLETQSIVHHDIKPQNIIDSSGQLHLIDFGISKEVSDRTVGMTTSFGGTSGFTAPEKFLNKKADGRSDFYSLGMLLACLITQTRPQDALTLIDEDFELKKDLVIDEYSKELVELIRRLVSRRPSDRPSSAKEAGELLDTKSVPTGKKSLDKKNIKAKKLAGNLKEDRSWYQGKIIRKGKLYLFQKLKFWSTDLKQNYIFYIPNYQNWMSRRDLIWASEIKFTKSSDVKSDKLKDALLDYPLSVTKIYRELDKRNSINKFIANKDSILETIGEQRFRDSQILEKIIGDNVILDSSQEFVLICFDIKKTTTTVLIDIDSIKPFWIVPNWLNKISDAIDWREGRASTSFWSNFFFKC